jgi:hypothetical protein
MRSSGFRVIDIIQGWCRVVWSSDHLSLQMYPHHPFCRTCNHTPTMNQNSVSPMAAGMESIPKKIPGLALCYLCIHILQWKDSPPPNSYTIVYITDQRIASPGPTYHAKSRWSGSRGGNNLPAYFQFPAPKSKFVNPHLKVRMTIYFWSTKKSTWCLRRMLREKGI